MSRGVIYGCAADETHDSLRKAIDVERVKILSTKAMSRKSAVLITFAFDTAPLVIRYGEYLKWVVEYKAKLVAYSKCHGIDVSNTCTRNMMLVGPCAVARIRKNKHHV